METNNRNNKNHAFDFEQSAKSGMKVPDGYFKDFDATIMAKIKESSFQNESPQKTGMKVPEGYFDDFEKNMLAQVQTSSVESQTPIIPLQKRVNYSYIAGIVAVAAALIWGAFWVYSPEPTNVDTTDELFAELTVEDWEYFEEGVDDYLLAENFTLEELDEISLVEENNISTDELYEYLLEENISDYTLSFYETN